VLAGGTAAVPWSHGEGGPRWLASQLAGHLQALRPRNAAGKSSCRVGELLRDVKDDWDSLVELPEVAVYSVNSFDGSHFGKQAYIQDQYPSKW